MLYATPPMGTTCDRCPSQAEIEVADTDGIPVSTLCAPCYRRINRREPPRLTPEEIQKILREAEPSVAALAARLREARARGVNAHPDLTLD